MVWFLCEVRSVSHRVLVEWVLAKSQRVPAESRRSLAALLSAVVLDVVWLLRRVRGCPSGSRQNSSGSQRSPSLEYGFSSWVRGVSSWRVPWLNSGGSWLNPCGCWSNTTGSQQGLLPTVVVVVRVHCGDAEPDLHIGATMNHVATMR